MKKLTLFLTFIFFQGLAAKDYNVLFLISDDLTYTAFDPPRYSHVINLAYSCRVISMMSKMLRPCPPISDLRSGVFVSECTSSMGIVSRHERCSWRAAVSALAVCLSESNSFGSEFVYIRGLANFISVTGKSGVGQIIWDDEEDIVVFSSEALGKKKCKKNG